MSALGGVYSRESDPCLSFSRRGSLCNEVTISVIATAIVAGLLIARFTGKIELGRASLITVSSSLGAFPVFILAKRLIPPLRAHFLERRAATKPADASGQASHTATAAQKASAQASRKSSTSPTPNTLPTILDKFLPEGTTLNLENSFGLLRLPSEYNWEHKKYVVAKDGETFALIFSVDDDGEHFVIQVFDNDKSDLAFLFVDSESGEARPIHFMKGDRFFTEEDGKATDCHTSILNQYKKLIADLLS